MDNQTTPVIKPSHWDRAIHFFIDFIVECSRNTGGVMTNPRVSPFLKEECFEIEFRCIHPTDGHRMVRLLLFRDGTWRLLP